MERNKKKINVLVNTNATPSNYISFLQSEYDVTVVSASNYQDENIDLILFAGGEDVDPLLYNENKGNYTYINERRDNFELDYMFHRFNPKVPKLGICRGAQFLTVASGGGLIQHVTNHGSSHPIELLRNGNVYEITSTHHQMMFPYKLSEQNYNILAASKYYLSDTYLDGDNNEKVLPKNFLECEIVYYINSNSLCIQGHPEFENCPEETKQMCLKLIKNVLKL